MGQLFDHLQNAPRRWKHALHRRGHVFSLRDGLSSRAIQVVGTGAPTESTAAYRQSLEPPPHVCGRHWRVDVVRTHFSLSFHRGVLSERRTLSIPQVRRSHHTHLGTSLPIYLSFLSVSRRALFSTDIVRNAQPRLLEHHPRPNTTYVCPFPSVRVTADVAITLRLPESHRDSLRQLAPRIVRPPPRAHAHPPHPPRRLNIRNATSRSYDDTSTPLELPPISLRFARPSDLSSISEQDDARGPQDVRPPFLSLRLMSETDVGIHAAE